MGNNSKDNDDAFKEQGDGEDEHEHDGIGVDDGIGGAVDDDARTATAAAAPQQESKQEAAAAAAHSQETTTTPSKSTTSPTPSSSPNFIRISELTPSDVVCGRGIPWTSYEGNQLMHQVVDGFRDKYLNCQKKEKRYWVQHALSLLKREYGTRFVKQVSNAKANANANSASATSTMSQFQQEAKEAEEHDKNDDDSGGGDNDVVDDTKAAAPVLFQLVDDQGECA
ncbi:MAG: hypothetical protein SGARI_000268, partial [Bacillariaceae sp.]